MTHTWLEISRTAFYHNIASVKTIVGTTQLGLMLKADAYGHGVLPMALLAQEHPAIDYIFTSLASDAVKLRAHGVTKRLCVLVVRDRTFEELISNDIDIVLYDRDQLESLQRAVATVGKPLRIHLKVDTGMSRLGMSPDDAINFLSEMHNDSSLQLVGIMTHLCDADNVTQESIEFTQRQLALFDHVVQYAVEHCSATLEVVHACASAGAIFFHDRCALVRLGNVESGGKRLVRVATNLLGYFKPNAQRERVHALGVPFEIRPIMTWKTRIIQLKKVPEGSCVGYNRTYTTTGQTLIATIPVGYFDGYPRGLSNLGSVLIRGVYAPIIGRVSMNMSTVDVTEVPGVSLHDVVILMGDYENITADDLAKKAGIMNLEMLTGIHAGIPRVVVE